MFIRNYDEAGVYVESHRPVFKRGRRIDETTARRLRDLLILFLYRLPMVPGDIARVMSLPLSERMVRYRLAEVMQLDDARVEIARIVQKRERRSSKSCGCQTTPEGSTLG